jgi:GNAT superfamily N-acetyltransferase
MALTNLNDELEPWLAAGGDARRLTMYRMLQAVVPLANQEGRCLVFANGNIGDFTGGPCLLARAESMLRVMGLPEAVGPMDGNTFFPYRCITEQSVFPTLPMDVSSSPSVWRAAGYREEARYVSVYARNTPRLLRPTRLPDGWQFRAFNMNHIDEELDALYRVTCAAFALAWRYVPIPREMFHAVYRPLLPVIDPGWVFLLDDPRGVVRGYFLNFPAGNVFIAKTLALDPAVQGAGLSWALVAAAHRKAHELGMSGGIHALMHESAVSNAFGGEESTVVRRYALYRKRL